MAVVVLQNIDEPLNKKLQVAWEVRSCDGSDRVTFARSGDRFTVAIHRTVDPTCEIAALRRLRLDLAEPVNADLIELIN